MAYQLSYTGQQIDNLLYRASLLDNQGKAPFAVTADHALISESATSATTAINATNATSANYATTAENATNATNAPNYLPLTGGTLTGTLTANNIINKEAYHCEVYYSGSGDTSFSGIVIFNSVKQNIGNCYSTSTGKFTCPVKGIYLVCFTYYGNSSSTSQRATIFKNDKNMTMHNGNYGNTVTAVLLCDKNDTLHVGAQTSNYTLSLYAADAHNLLTITLLSRME